MFRHRLVNNALISFFIANLLISIGKSDVWSRYFDLLPRHYLDLLLTFLSVFIVFEYTDRANQYLNARISWMEQTSKRILFQLLLGILVPALLAILLTFLMWEFIWHQNLVADGYFTYEFLPQILFITVVNLYFLVVYLFRHKTTESVASEPKLIARRGSTQAPLKSEDIAELYLKEGVIRATTFDGNLWVLSENMDHYEQMLPSASFFRANRQQIVHKKTCGSFRAIENGKIELTLLSDERPVIISQKRAAAFRRWIKS